jgi:hypothetical protein
MIQLGWPPVTSEGDRSAQRKVSVVTAPAGSW